MKAIWNDQLIAESNETIVIENNHYFPHDSLQQEFFKISDTHSTCSWKGKASYYTIEVDGEKNEDAAWYYSDPSERAKSIQNHVAFWKGVKITE